MQWLFREVHGYPLWSWLFIAAILIALIVAAIVGWDMNRCNSYGDCLYEY